MSVTATQRRLLPASDPVTERWPVWSAAAGGTLLATCLCPAGRILFGGGTAMASTRPGINVYTIVLGTAALLIVLGLGRISRRAAILATAGAATFFVANLVAPQPTMAARALGTHGPQHFLGFALLLTGIGLIVSGFLSAFPTRRNTGASRCAAGAFGAAAGCACCVSIGSAVWLGVGAGALSAIPASPWADGVPFMALMLVAALALHRVAGPHWALLALAGAVIAIGGDEGLKPLLADDIELLPRLLVTLLGTATIMYAFVRGFAAAGAGASPPPRHTAREAGSDDEDGGVPVWRDASPSPAPARV